jgi:hypothetical protein
VSSAQHGSHCCSGEPAQVTVSLSTATYSELALWVKGHAGADGQHLTVAQVIEELANK